MRLFAQIAFAAIVVFLALTWKAALLLPFLWPFFVVAASPIVYYVIFERHRELKNDELLMQLEMLRNAVIELGTKAAASQLLPR